MTERKLNGRGIYDFRYDETDTLTASDPEGLAQVTRWEPYPEDFPDLEVGVSDTTREIREEYDDPPRVVPAVHQHALRLKRASTYRIWGFEETICFTATEDRLWIGLFNVLRHGMQALRDAGVVQKEPPDPEKFVELAECVHCGRITLNPADDECARIKGVLIVATLLLLLTACCGGGDAPPQCEEGTKQRCECTLGVPGMQTCLNGRWAPCACWVDDAGQ